MIVERPFTGNERAARIGNRLVIALNSALCYLYAPAATSWAPSPCDALRSHWDGAYELRRASGRRRLSLPIRERAPIGIARATGGHFAKRVSGRT